MTPAKQPNQSNRRDGHSGRDWRNWLNLGLLVLLGALITVVILQPGKEPAPAAVRVSPVDAASITHMTLSRPGQADIQLVRDAQHRWQMQAPYRAAASAFMDADLQALLHAESSAHYPSSDINAADIGLQPPLATLTLNDTVIRFGDIDPVHGNRYLQIGDTIHLLPDHLAPYPELGALEMLSSALLPPDDPIVSLRLPALSADSATDGLPTTLPQLITRQDGRWQIEPPLSLSGDALPGLINEWQYAQAIAVAPLSSTPSPTPGRIEIGLQSGRQLRFELLQTRPDLILASSDAGLRYQLSQQQAERLLHPAAHNPPPTAP